VTVMREDTQIGRPFAARLASAQPAKAAQDRDTFRNQPLEILVLKRAVISSASRNMEFAGIH